MTLPWWRWSRTKSRTGTRIADSRRFILNAGHVVLRMSSNTLTELLRAHAKRYGPAMVVELSAALSAAAHVALIMPFRSGIGALGVPCNFPTRFRTCGKIVPS